MTTEVKVPRLAESISDAVLVEWLKEDGAAVRADEAIVTLETDKAAVEIASPEPGVLRHARQVGERVVVGDVLARIENGAVAAKPAAGAASPAKPEGSPAGAAPAPKAAGSAGTEAPAPRAAQTTAPAARPGATAAPSSPAEPREGNGRAAEGAGTLSPAVRRLVEEHRLDPSRIPATGRGGRLLKEDVLRFIEEGGAAKQPAAASGAAPGAGASALESAAPSAPESAATARLPEAPGRAAPALGPVTPDHAEDERVVPMSRIRQRIAERLVHAQQTAAILTTFNELDMTAVLELRARYRESFEKRHGVRLGFMSFFTRACVLAIEEVPELNAEIRGTDVVYKRRVHMGVAVGTERGLVVPVVRDAGTLGLAEIEREIGRLAGRARDGTLTLQELSGGTFTISNGGVYGSLLSTPILNPPQTGILGMHKIEKRPIAVDDQVVIRPMMYVALSYDHRLVDGEQAVTFLVRVKERIEDPERMLLEV